MEGPCDHAWQASGDDPCLLSVQAVEWFVKHNRNGERMLDHDTCLTRSGVLNPNSSTSQPGRWIFGKCGNEAVLFAGHGDATPGITMYFDSATGEFLALEGFWPDKPNSCGGHYWWPVRFDSQQWPRR
ncbi:MAG: hypothetical protein KJ749_06015 [Planctomycetes bacterium]|nr:hypothetical protein [Planctomycetota bacterium]